MSTNDERVLKLLATVKEKQDAIAKAEKSRYETSCSIGRDPDSAAGRINLQVETNIVKLVSMYGFIDEMERQYKTGAKELGVTSQFSWMNHSAKEWKTDIKTRIDHLNLKNKRKELADLQEKVDKLVSPEQRRELELAQLEKELLS